MVDDLRTRINKCEYDLTQIENAVWVLENDLKNQGLKTALRLLEQIKGQE